LTTYLCVTCGTQYAPSQAAPAHCPICEDERQYVGLEGQQWVALEELRKTHRNVVYEEGDRLWGIHTQPKFAIGQRALLLETGRGGFLWDCISLIDEDTVRQVKARGGLTAMAVSHPHYYTSMVEWSHAFGGVPIYLHEADRQWVQRPDPAIVFWSGETHQLSDDLTLIRVGGHFDGFQVLHWSAGEQGRGVLMTGDMPQVCPDRRYLSFMYSYPNFVPVSAATVRDIVQKLEPLAFVKLHGAWPKFSVEGNPKVALRRSAKRYLKALGDSEPLDAEPAPVMTGRTRG
jgi:hypothetical protein